MCSSHVDVSNRHAWVASLQRSGAQDSDWVNLVPALCFCLGTTVALLRRIDSPFAERLELLRPALASNHDILAAWIANAATTAVLQKETRAVPPSVRHSGVVRYVASGVLCGFADVCQSAYPLEEYWLEMAALAATSFGYLGYNEAIDPPEVVLRVDRMPAAAAMRSALSKMLVSHPGPSGVAMYDAGIAFGATLPLSGWDEAA